MNIGERYTAIRGGGGMTLYTCGYTSHVKLIQVLLHVVKRVLYSTRVGIPMAGLVCAM